MFFRLLLLVILPFLLYGEGVHYGPFIDKQIELTLRLNDPTIDEHEIEKILEEKERLFNEKLESVLANKTKYLNNGDPYRSKIYKLQKIIEINKRRGNTKAVIRDEVHKLSYKILQSQYRMFQGILHALDLPSFDEFEDYVNKAFVETQEEIGKLTSSDYKRYMELKDDSPVVKVMKQRILEYYAILDINADLLKTIVNNERKMYRLNKYYRYGLIRPVLLVNHTAVAKSLEPVLAKVNLSAVKIILILFIFLAMYFVKVFSLKLFTRIFEKFKFRSRVINNIIAELRRPITILTIFIGVNLIFYIYNDFSRTNIFSTLFDMFYTLILMWMIYKVLNIVAAAKIAAFADKETSVKRDLINITIKIVNFILLLFTVLLILHQAGVNLTAILSGLGIGGFAIALAAKESLANFFGTLSILMSDTFSQGDWIAVDGAEGVIVEIGLRVTTIRTFDNALISIPNFKLANEAIKNWSRRKIGRRIKFKVHVCYNSDRQNLQKTIEDIQKFLASHEGIAKENSKANIDGLFHTAKIVSKNDALGIKNLQLVTIDELDDTSINILIYCFTVTTVWKEWAKIRDDVILNVIRIIEENGLEFALPTMALHHKDELKVKLLSQKEV